MTAPPTARPGRGHVAPRQRGPDALLRRERAGRQVAGARPRCPGPAARGSPRAAARLHCCPAPALPQPAAQLRRSARASAAVAAAELPPPLRILARVLVLSFCCSCSHFSLCTCPHRCRRMGRCCRLSRRRIGSTPGSLCSTRTPTPSPARPLHRAPGVSIKTCSSAAVKGGDRQRKAMKGSVAAQQTPTVSSSFSFSLSHVVVGALVCVLVRLAVGSLGVRAWCASWPPPLRFPSGPRGFPSHVRLQFPQTHQASRGVVRVMRHQRDDATLSNLPACHLFGCAVRVMRRGGFVNTGGRRALGSFPSCLPLPLLRHLGPQSRLETGIMIPVASR